MNDFKHTHVNNNLNLKYKIQYKMMRTLTKIISFFSIKVVYSVARFLGTLSWYLMPKRREIAIHNVKKHLGYDTLKSTKIAKASFKENFCSFCELLYTKKFLDDTQNFKVKFVSPENWEKLTNDKYPLVGTTAHMGAWELLASMLGKSRKEGIPRLVIVRKYPNPAVDKFITEQREATGGTMVGHRMAAPQVLRALRKNGVAAFLVDHKPKSSESITLPFLNSDTDVNVGPALLAVRAKALVVPIFLNRTDDGYVCHVYDALDTNELVGSNEEKIKTVALFYTKAVEKHIKSYPEQWFWMHDRWKDFKTNKQKERVNNAEKNAS